MRFTISSTALSSRLQALSRVINSKNSLFILDCFLFEITNGELHLTASDGENVMQTIMPIEDVDGEGSFAVQNHTILDAVKELPEQPLHFEVDQNVATGHYPIKVLYQNGMYNFTAQNAEEFPRLEFDGTNPSVITINSEVLSNNLGRTLFATAQDELRPVMNGIYFDLTADSLAIVASDGHKLVRNKNYSIKSDTPAAFILPKKPASLLKNVLQKDGGDVVIKFDAQKAEIRYADGMMICRLIEGRYPNYNSVIPKENPNELTIDRKSLIGALRRVIPFASESSQLIRFHLEAGKLVLSSEDADYSTSAKESLTCDYNGQNMNIGFKGSSLTEILSNLDSDDIQILLSDPSRAGIVVPTKQPDNEDVLMLIMPMLLND